MPDSAGLGFDAVLDISTSRLLVYFEITTCQPFNEHVSAIMEIIEENKITAIMKNGVLKDFSIKKMLDVKLQWFQTDSYPLSPSNSLFTSSM